MPRSNPVCYIAPSSISITPNANGSPNDLAVYLARDARIKVYSIAIPALDMVDGNCQEWKMTGRNRRLSDGNVPYTIYARLEKSDDNGKNGYLVFAPRQWHNGEWTDKYSSVTNEGDGLSVLYTDNGFDVTVSSPDYWYVRLGTVSLPSDGKRTVYLDTGILGTDQYNSQWQIVAQDMSEQMARIRRNISPDISLLGWTIHRPTLVTSEYVRAMKGEKDPFATDTLKRPVISLSDTTPRMMFYSSDPDGLPVPDYGGLSAEWDDMWEGDDNYATNAPVTVNLPFAAPRVLQPFITAMTELLGSQSEAELAELKAREYIGNTVELSNFSQEAVIVRGLYAPTVSVTPWDAFSLLPNMRIRATSIITSDNQIVWHANSIENAVPTYQADTWLSLGLAGSGADTAGNP